MRVAVLQSNYIPWKGYFDLIDQVDRFIFYDDVQYTKNDWRNRNKIRTAKGSEWLTVPVGRAKGQLINEVTFDNSIWQRKHWKTISMNYSKAPFFHYCREFLEDFFLEREWRFLSEMNQFFIREICQRLLPISTVFDASECYSLLGSKQERLGNLLSQVGCSTYLSGPTAKNYLADHAFADIGVEIQWMDYSGYPEYPQNGPGFDHFVSIVDLLMNKGPDSIDYIRNKSSHKAALGRFRD